MVSFTLRPIYPRGKSHRYSLDRRLDKPQSRCGHCGEDETLLLVLEIERRFLSDLAPIEPLYPLRHPDYHPVQFIIQFDATQRMDLRNRYYVTRE
jgi:hypothetical protein